MLVLSRRVGEDTVLVLPDGRQVRMTVLATKGTEGIRIGWEAPHDVLVKRAEIAPPTGS